MERRKEIRVSKEKLALWSEVLSVEEGHYEAEDRDAVIDVLSVDFGHGIEADIKLCNGDTPYIDNVLFDRDSEVDVPEISETLLGEYQFTYEGRDYIVDVLSEKLEDSIEVGEYISVTDDNGTYLGVVSAIRENDFTLHGMMLLSHYEEYVTRDPRVHDVDIKFEEVHEHQTPLYPLHSYLADEFKHNHWKKQQENSYEAGGINVEAN